MLVQVQLDGLAQADDVIEVRLVDTVSRREIISRRLVLLNCDASALDDIVLVCDPPGSAFVDVVCSTSIPGSRIRLRHLKIIRSAAEHPARTDFADRTAVLPVDRVKAVFIGGTNVCNANCPHCPTNKTMTRHLAQGVMAMPLFENFLSALDAVEITDCLLFGVFGEPFADPHLEDRIRLIHAWRPGLPIDIASNAELATPDRVATIARFVRRISLHVEAVTPETYNKLMVPLKADDVFPRIAELMRVAPGKIAVTTPLHRGNLHEVPAMRQYWARHGIEVDFSQLQTRATDRTMAQRVALAPTGGFWKPDLLDILVVDWDGAVLATCDDFLRRQVLGNLNDSSLADILRGPARRAVFDALCNYDWQALPSVRDAIVDDQAMVAAFAGIPLPRMDRWEVAASRLRCTDDAERVPPGLLLGHRAPEPTDAPVAYGPYLNLPDGRYLARFVGALSVGTAAPQTRIAFEVAAGFGAHGYASVERRGAELAEVDLSVEFRHVAAHGAVECRIFVLRADPASPFHLAGVTFTRIAD